MDSKFGLQQQQKRERDTQIETAEIKFLKGKLKTLILVKSSTSLI
jgi:hypothetical protein